MLRHYHYFIDGKYHDHGRDIYKGVIPNIGDTIEPFSKSKFLVKGLRYHKKFDGGEKIGYYETIGLDVNKINI